MEVLQGAVGGPQLLRLEIGVIAVLLTVVAVCCLPSLMEHWRRWWVMKPIPGVSPCFPVLGNALHLARGGEGKGSSHRGPAVRSRALLKEPALLRCLSSRSCGWLGGI